MSEDLSNLVRVYEHPAEKPLVLWSDPPAGEQTQPAPAADTAPAQHPEDSPVADFLGLWFGTMWLAHLAEEHFREPAEEAKPASSSADPRRGSPPSP
jgi:hypothetical protein